MSTADIRTLAIASGKGGVGKSFLALNLAWCLAELGQRVLLIELDREAGALCIAAGLGAPAALAPATDAATMATRVLTVPGAPRVQLLRACDIPVDAARSALSLAPLLSDIPTQWRIADLAPGLGAQTVLWLNRAERAILIGTPELVTVQAMLRLQQHLQHQHVFEHLRSVDPRLRTCAPSLAAIKREVGTLYGEQAKAIWADAWNTFRFPAWVFNRTLPDDQTQLLRIKAHLKTQAGERAAHPWLIPEDAAQTRCSRFGRVLLRHEPACDAARAIRNIATELCASVAASQGSLATESAA